MEFPPYPCESMERNLCRVLSNKIHIQATVKTVSEKQWQKGMGGGGGSTEASADDAM